MKKIPWSPIVGTLAAAGLLVVIIRSVNAGPPSTPVDKDVKKAQRTTLPAGGVDERSPIPKGDYVAGNGIVEPAQRETKVSAPLAGLIVKVNVKEGDKVEAGKVLVELDSSAEKAAVESAEAEIKVAESELSRVKSGSKREDIDAAAADAVAAKTRAELSATSLARTEALAKTGAATVDELDRAKSALATDLASARAADSRRKSIAVGSRREEIDLAKAKMVSATARRDEAKTRVERLTVRAPYAGEILQIKLHAGEYFVPGSAEPLMILGDTSKFRVRIDVDERDLARLKSGANAFVTVDAFRDQRFVGKVAEVGRRMGRKNVRTDDPTERIDTKILEVVLDLERSDGLYIGQRVMGYVDAKKP